MKIARIAALGLALGLAASPAYALVDVSAFGGYATVSMKDVNSAIDSYASLAGGTATDMGGGFYVGVDAGYSLLPFLKIGPRIKYLQAGQGKVASSSGAATIDANLMAYEVGVSVDTSLPLTGLSVQGGIWGGYGMANANADASSLGGSASTGTGSSFVGEIAAQLRYKLVAGLSVGLDLGYSLANIATVNGSDGKALLSDSTGKADGFDFSGLNVGGAVGWNF